jgi:hypothetical protein
MPIFRKTLIFAKTLIFLQKSTSLFCKNRIVAEKLQKLEKKIFAESIFGRGSGKFLQKSDRIFAKIVFFDAKTDFCKHFHNVVRYIPMG